MTLATAALARAYNAGSWGTFFAFTGTAAATLTGLFFVAFSLRVRELQFSLPLRIRARYLLTWLVAIAVGSGFVLMPGQSRAALATEILVVSVGCVAATVWSLRAVRSESAQFPPDLIARWVGMAATWLLSLGAGVSLLAGHGGGLYLLAFAVLLGIALQVAAAWTLVVETGKHDRIKETTADDRLPAAGSGIVSDEGAERE